MPTPDESRGSAGGPGAGEGLQSFELLYEQSASRVFGLCLRLLGSPAEAEDAAGEACLKACRAHADFEPGRPFASWILTIAGRVCIDRLRRRRLERRWFPRDLDGAPEAPARDPGPLARLLTVERQRQVRRRIAELPERYRLVLVLRYYADLPYAEIAALLGLERNHVAVLIHRAKLRLRAALDAGASEAP